MLTTSNMSPQHPSCRRAMASTSTPNRSPLAVRQVQAQPHSCESPFAIEALQKKRTAAELAPPSNCQFLTVFDCKYYGKTMIGGVDPELLPGSCDCANLVKQTVRANARKHRQVMLKVTDHGASICGKLDGTVTDVPVDVIRRIVPGTLKSSKSGKELPVAVLIERPSSTSAENTTVHVFQFKRSGDLRYLSEASKRMWRDHMFNALLDVSSEEGQDMFDSFTIEQDIHAANTRCSTLMQGEAFSFEKALEGLL